MKPILNPISQKIIITTVANMPQSVLITGESGVGLSTAARYIGELLSVKPSIILPEKDEKIDLEKGVISIDIVRKISENARTKLKDRRLIVIDYAERMTHQAQNAFLKLLEEPGEGIYFILVSSSTSKLLPTILSRVKKIEIKPITSQQSENLINELGIVDKTKQAQLLFMASGLPAEITRLIQDESYFTSASNIVRDAREALQGRLYQKLLIAQRYKDNRQLTLKMILYMAKILKHSIETNPQADTIRRVDIVLKTYERVEANGNIRLCLAQMMI
jgi:DNA polymerase-3 subunit delta'